MRDAFGAGVVDPVEVVDPVKVGMPGSEGGALPLLGMLGIACAGMTGGVWLLWVLFPKEEVGIKGKTKQGLGSAGPGGSSLDTMLDTRSISCHYKARVKASPSTITL